MLIHFFNNNSNNNQSFFCETHVRTQLLTNTHSHIITKKCHNSCTMIQCHLPRGGERIIIYIYHILHKPVFQILHEPIFNRSPKVVPDIAFALYTRSLCPHQVTCLIMRVTCIMMMIRIRRKEMGVCVSVLLPGIKATSERR